MARLTVQGVDVSRTESLVVALAECLDAKSRIDAIRRRYESFDAKAVGEPPLATALHEPEAHYTRKLDALRALLTNAGVSV